jgi:DNA-binding GntR family transcriptional regulator
MAALNLSPTPSKEAFTRLENDGYVVTIPRRGMFARGPSASEIRQVFEIRKLLEGVAIRRACATMSEKAITRTKKINGLFSRAVQSVDAATYTRAGTKSSGR